MYVERYSPASNSWTKVADAFDARHSFSVCAVANKILTFGGWSPEYPYPVHGSCLQLDTADFKWKELAEMKVGARAVTACSLLNGTVVVTGGMDQQHKSQSVATSQSLVLQCTQHFLFPATKI